MSKQFVLVPLYIYPAPGEWEPLSQAAAAFPDAHFVAVVNPDNGPGEDALPDENYREALAKLAKHPNITVVGYVYCSYGKRDGEAVRRDIDAYAAWNKTAGLTVSGIFIDEAPSEPEYVTYMARLTERARSQWQEGFRKQCIVVYNPGVVVAREFFEHPDYVVVLEASQEQWQNLFIEQDALSALEDRLRFKASVIIHSSGTDAADGEGMRGLVQQAQLLGLAGVYATDQLEGGYTQWPADWMGLAEAVSWCN
ncbi:hypothetical protein VHEMI10414 [[Torrubiella] hemipterigena]|uniref:Spherulation-specific family 4 n=1 Tax=[Torrubiella] hemipterigena TaxID=1531966 RepID=A0A0A1TT82_9HYPO|nr:hypothetical protein VHEMI10414 [[Torrubiella] hemipterigena]